MAITSRDQMIDTSTISKGCDIIDQAVQDYAKCAQYISNAASLCSSSALAVEKQSMQPVLEEIAASVYTQQEAEYNDYVAAQEAKKANNA